MRNVKLILFLLDTLIFFKYKKQRESKRSLYTIDRSNWLSFFKLMSQWMQTFHILIGPKFFQPYLIFTKKCFINQKKLKIHTSHRLNLEIQKVTNYPYIFSIPNNPFFPRPVCFSPRIAINVPTGRFAFVLGIIVIFVPSLKRLTSAIPWVACRCSIHPSFLRSLINSKPVKAGIFWYFKYSGLP